MKGIGGKIRKPIYGFGINDADYVTQPSKGTRCPYFDRWHSMLRRCYSENSIKRNVSYVGCFVSQEWKYFTSFKAWMSNHPWEGNSLDKDILVFGNREYGPDYCIFVPDYVNAFFSTVSTKKTELPLGVHMSKKLKVSPYIAQGAVDCKRLHLGCAPTPESAHYLWQKWKLESAYKYQAMYQLETSFDSRVNYKFEMAIELLKNQILDGVETTHIVY